MEVILVVRFLRLKPLSGAIITRYTTYAFCHFISQNKNTGHDCDLPFLGSRSTTGPSIIFITEVMALSYEIYLCFLFMIGLNLPTILR